MRVSPTMVTDKPRIAPLPMSEWGDKEKEALAVFVKPGVNSLKGGDKNKSKDVSALAIFLNHPSLAKAIFPLTRHLLYDCLLPNRDRELLVLRVAWLRKAPYEWAQHVAIAQNCGVSDEEILRVGQGESAVQWTPKDKLLMTAVDELFDSACLSDTTWGGLGEFYNEQELMEVVVTVGAYDLMAMAFNSFGLQTSEDLEAVLAQFPLSSGD